MSFPVVASTSTADNLTGNSVTVTLPTGIADGDVVVIFFASGFDTCNITFPGGWTQYTQHNTSSPDRPHLHVAYRVCNGSEGASITVSRSGGDGREGMCYIAYRMTGADAVEVSAGTEGTSFSAADPASLTTTWGLTDVLWFVTSANENSSSLGLALPSGYGNSAEATALFDGVATGDAAATLHVGRKELNATTENPGAFATYTKRWCAFTVAVRGTLATDPPDPPDPIDYIPPAPSNAVIEIRSAAVNASRWGVAVWGPPSVWAAAEWIDVTPESVDATVRWGSHSPEAGVLTETEPASWLVNTYDPDRLLDPGNTDSPYHTDLRAGLPIRIRHRGTIVRQGVAEQILFQHKDHIGGIRVTDNVSIMARSKVPADIELSDTLRARARDVIAAAGLRITVEPDPPSGDPALAPQLDDERSVWRHVADAAEQVLHVPYLDNVGTLHFRSWDSPYDRARGVDSTQLVDLGTLVSTRGLYSVVRAQQTAGDGGLLIERRVTPVPRYGSVVYARTDPTPDADDWAAAVLADRSLQTVQWIPGAIYPLTADDVEYFATLESMERFGVDFIEATPPVDITGIIVGGSFTVVSKKDSEAIWSFEVELAQTADSPLYTDTDPPEFLLNEAGDGYLYAD